MTLALRKMHVFTSTVLLGTFSLSVFSQAPAPARAQASVTATLKAPAKAIFAGGCFWCVEADFDKVPGVLGTVSGYIGGKTVNPTYEQVSSKSTGHAEAVEITFDPAKVSYNQLLTYYWKSIDPTTKDQQFCDSGSPYRTAIFALNALQLQAAKESKTALDKTKPFHEPIVTEIVLAGTFYPAEGYHQDYYLKKPLQYKFYRTTCGRDKRLAQLWDSKPAK